jgi:gliding motility-associated-like protein
MKNTLAILLICFFVLHSLAQSEAANWYFGFGAGITFDKSTNTIMPVNDGQIFTNEGCATISDSNGNLLFYTDGGIIWNSAHQIMTNGTGLYGDASSTQSAIIVPKPDDLNIYYVFTVDNDIDGFDFGLNYSEVDMSLNGGLGGVVKKNTNLLETCSEKITAVVKDCISKHIWVVTFSTQDGSLGFFNTYHAFEISTIGVNKTSIKSTFPDLQVADARGYLKLSPDGKKMASANMVGTLDETTTKDRLLLYDFNTATGKVNNQIQLEVSGDNNFPYGIEFSPNNKLLYVTASNNFFDFENRRNNEIPENHSSSLVQFDVTSGNVQSTEFTLDLRNLYRGGLQLGPDGKIYRALCETYSSGLPFLGVINSPNGLGMSSYQHNAINISPNLSTQGLPPFITSFFAEKIDIIGNQSTTTSLPLCNGETYTLKSPIIPGAKYTWTRNEQPLSNNTFDFEVSQPGLYKVVIDPNNGDCGLLEGIAFVTYSPVPTAYNATLIQCDEDGISGGFTRFNLNEANTELTGGIDGLSTKFYSDIARTLKIIGSNYKYDANNPNPIYVEVIDNQTNCFGISTLTLQVNTVLIDYFIATPLCDELDSEDGKNIFNLDEITSEIQVQKAVNVPINYYETFENSLLEKNALSASFTNTKPYSQTIYARFENQNACAGIIEVSLLVNKLPNVETNGVAYYCVNKFPETIALNGGNFNSGNITDASNNYSFEWSTGENTYQIDINEAKKYTVLITNKITNCSKERTIDVQPSSIAENPSFEVTDATQNNVISVLTTGNGIYEYAISNDLDNFYIPFQNSNVFENIPPGIHKILIKDIKNDCGTLAVEVPVIGFPKFFTPNNDGINDTWQVFGISDSFYSNSKILIYNRYGVLIKEINPLGKGWDGLFNGNILPTDDYWFSVTLDDGRIYKNHFTLKR